MQRSDSIGYSSKLKFENETYNNINNDIKETMQNQFIYCIVVAKKENYFQSHKLTLLTLFNFEGLYTLEFGKTIEFSASFKEFFLSDVYSHCGTHVE